MAWFGKRRRERRVQAIGTELLGRAKRLQPSGGFSEKLMHWAMSDERFKTQLFRFIDVFPALERPEDVHRHLEEYLQQPDLKPPPGLHLGLAAGGWAKGALSRTVARQVQQMAARFIAGESVEAALPTLRARWDEGMGFSLDLLGEACVSEEEADREQQRYLDAIDRAAAEARAWRSRDALDRDHLGAIPRANVSVKITALAAKVDPVDPEASIERVATRLEPVARRAGERGVLLNFDMEHRALKDLTLALFGRVCERVDFPAGIALQAYLRSAEDDAERLIRWSKRAGRPVTVRLVKGAYWDFEMIHAEKRAWPTPVWRRKADTDACFERVAERLIDGAPTAAGEGGTRPAIGSHNLRSIAHALGYAEDASLPPEAVELQTLYGMAEGIKRAAVERGLRMREYVPVGEPIAGMAYLVRRLLENTSNESWLRAGFDRDAPAGRLLASPHDEAERAEPADPVADAPEWHRLSPAVEGVGDGRPFHSEPPTDFADADARRRFGEGAAGARLEQVPLSDDPADAERAVGAAAEAFPAWRDTPARERARMLVDAAARLRADRPQLAGIMMRESGKNWPDADADVGEAIDFCEYYARQGAALFEPRRHGRFVGEHNLGGYEPRGVAAVISPWNLPLAITAGMTTAALVTGNTAVVKPAEQSPVIAKRLCEALWAAGVPEGALRFVPGRGESVGEALVADKRIALIAFTGSRATGLGIVERAAPTPLDQPHVKRVVCEMGGKNAIVVDASADLEEAVTGVRDAAFLYAGQRCSACSRAIVVGDAHDRFLERLTAASRALVLGDPAEPDTDLGFVIDAEAGEKIRRYIEIGKTEGTLELAVEPPEGLAARLGRPVIGPHIFSGIRPDHRLAQEEIFGPVLSVMRAGTFEEALAMATDTPYRLTGGVFSRTPSHLQRAREAFRVGNLYLNRGITGSLVGRQPFGGFGHSGVGSQAGGDDYLAQFVVPRTVCENTMRRGFAPSRSVQDAGGV